MTVAAPPSRFRVKVVGVSFVDGYPENLHRLKAAWLTRHTEGLPALLVRDPANEHDPNAVRVEVPAVGSIGHIPAHLAARLAPALDNGQTWQAEVYDIPEHPDFVERPGIEVTVWKVT